MGFRVPRDSLGTQKTQNQSTLKSNQLYSFVLAKDNRKIKYISIKRIDHLEIQIGFIQ